MNNSKQSKGWCFTINNWTPVDYAMALGMPHDYIIIGKEIGKKNKIPHLQGYVFMRNKLTFKQVKECLPRGNIRIAKGKPYENRDYCSKDGDFIEDGVCPVQGKRNDLDRVRNILSESGRIADVVTSASSLTQLKFAETAIKYIEKKRNWKPFVIWIYGPSGAGKTREAYEFLGENCYRKTNSTGQWWDGYDAHEDVLLDDLKADTLHYSTLLELLDRYECRVQFKGGSRQFLARRIVVTSIEHPDDLYRRESSELMRRIDVIKSLGNI